MLAFSARDGGALRDARRPLGDRSHDRTDRAQEIHLCIEHVICELVERESL